MEEQGLTTRYDYDFLKQITLVTDDQHNPAHISYDKLTLPDGEQLNHWAQGQSNIKAAISRMIY
jgi:hypothetical protein